MPRRISRVPRFTDVKQTISAHEVTAGDRLAAIPGQVIQEIAKAGPYTVRLIGQDTDEKTAGLNLVIDADEPVTVIRTVQVPEGTCATCLERPVKYQGLQQCGTCYARDHRDAGKAPKTAVS